MKGHDRTIAALVVPALLLGALTVTAYFPALHAGFAWDDDTYVTANSTLHSLAGLRRIWLDLGATPQYYPLTFTTFWLEYHVWGLQPFGYHLVNVLLHALNAVVLWRVLWRLRVPGAWLAAAIFALHPIQVESVAWVNERKNVLSGLFALTALLVYLRGIVSERADRTERIDWRSYLALNVLFLAALLSKTVTCTLPAVLLLIAWWRRGRIDRRMLVMVAPLFAMGIALASATLWVERLDIGATSREWVLSPIARTLVAGRALWFYPRTLLWPRSLAFIYPRWSIDPHRWWQYLFPIAAVALIAGLYGARKRIGNAPVVAALCYAGTLVPSLGLVNLYYMRYSFVADHFAYLPSIALIALAVAGGAALIQRIEAPGRYVGAAVGTAVVLLLAVLTARQCGIYQDLRTLWTDTLAKNPKCWLAHNDLGIVLAAEGDLDGAMTHFTEAMRLKPSYPETYLNVGNALLAQGKPDQAIVQFAEALRLKPASAKASYNMGVAYAALGKNDQAAAYLSQALRWDPASALAHHTLGRIRRAQGNAEEASAHFEQAIHLQPDDPEVHNDFGSLLRSQGNFQTATVEYAEAIRLRPAFADAHNNLGVVLATQGKLNEALAQFEQALHSQPDYPEAHGNIGNVLQAQGKLEEAVAEYAEALRLQPTNPETRNNAGMALLALGRTDEAIAQFEQALRWEPDFTQARENLNRAQAKAHGSGTR